MVQKSILQNQNSCAQNQVEKRIKHLLYHYKAGFDLSLARILSLLHKLDNPHLKIPPVFHIAGTNGKGSCSAFTRALLEAAGYLVHMHNSPHLVRWHERFRIADKNGGKFVEDALLAEVLKEIEQVNDGAPITVFEILTIAAFLLFHRFPADAVILEVGLGGRLDATNVIQECACALITPIAFDHENFLGTNIAQIASEKAGIIKKNCPVIIGQQPFEEALCVLQQKAKSLNAAFYSFGEDYYAYNEYDHMIFQDETGLLDLPLPKLYGAHQIENAALALKAVKQAGFKIETRHIETAWNTVYWPGRMQKLKNTPENKLYHFLCPKNDKSDFEIWLDGGHNPHAGQALKEMLKKQQGKDPKPLSIIFAMLDTKDSKSFLKNFCGFNANIYTISIPQNAQSLPKEQLKKQALDLGLRAKTASSLKEALKEIGQNIQEGRILICGSLYLCGEALKQNGTIPV